MESEAQGSTCLAARPDASVAPVQVSPPDRVALVRMLAASGESYYVELKGAWRYGPEGPRPRDVREIASDIGRSIVGFTNADGGDLLVGVEDGGGITGVPHELPQRLYLQQWRQHVQLPPEGDLPVRVFEVEVDGRIVLLFRVEAHPGAPVVTSDGRCLMRRGAETVPMSSEWIDRHRAHTFGDLDYEISPVQHATLADLDLSLLRHGRESTSARALEAFDDVGLLRYWNLVEQRNGSIVLRRAALLLFADNALQWHPNNRVRLRRVLGDEPGYGRNLRTQEQEHLGPIVRALPATIERLNRELEREARGDQLFVTSQLLPREAVEECVVNAFVHRNYAVEGQAIEILLYPDRVEFHSPGQLPDPITLPSLREQRPVHRSRNPVMMRVLRDLGWTRDQGEGIRRIFGSIRQAELHEPELEVFADTFIVRLSTRSIYDEATQSWIGAYGPYGLRPEERRYVVALRKTGGKRSVDRLARYLDEPFDATKKALADLDRRGIVWHATKSRSYHLVEPLEIPFERAYRRFLAHGITVDVAARIGRDEIQALLTSSGTQVELSDAIARWKEQGIVAPEARGQWKLGPGMLEYARHRGGRSGTRSS